MYFSLTNHKCIDYNLTSKLKDLAIVYRVSKRIYSYDYQLISPTHTGILIVPVCDKMKYDIKFVDELKNGIINNTLDICMQEAT
jgi:hypothetical protein